MLITSSFIIVNVGQYGGSADGGVFQRSEMDKRFYNRDIYIPELKTLPNAHNNSCLPH